MVSLQPMDLGGEENVSVHGVPTARPLVRCDRMSSRSGTAAWVVAVELCTAGKYRTSDLDDQLASTRGLGCRPVSYCWPLDWNRRRGRKRKRWEDNTREWTGLDVPESQRAVEDR